MPRTETILTVFVASPSDLREERGALEDIIREINTTWSPNTKVRLELVKWETHTYPDIGIDPQTTINEQIGDEYDIFIGLMWHRFGTPTNIAGSGTEEEYLRAYQKYVRDPNSISIMCYFKNAPISPRDIDPAQLAKVNEFRLKIAKHGVLYREFSDREEFESLCRIHLSKIFQQYLPSGKTDTNSEKSTAIQEAQPTATENEEGLLDLMDGMQNSFDALGEIMNKIAKATEEVGENIRNGSQEINQFKGVDLSDKISRQAVRRVISKTAQDLSIYNARMQSELPLFAEHLGHGMNAFNNAIMVSADFKTGTLEKEKAAQDIEDFQNELISATRGIEEFRNILNSMPRIQKDFNSAKSDAAETLSALIAEMSKARNISQEILESLRGPPEH